MTPARFTDSYDPEPAEKPSPEETAGLDETREDRPVPAWWPRWAEQCGIEPPDPNREELF